MLKVTQPLIFETLYADALEKGRKYPKDLYMDVLSHLFSSTAQIESVYKELIICKEYEKRKASGEKDTDIVMDISIDWGVSDRHIYNILYKNARVKFSNNLHITKFGSVK